MPRSKEIALFGKKLDLLLQRDAHIRTRARLAQELGIDASQITRWQNGREYAERRDRVPAQHVDAMCALFGIGHDWFEAGLPPGESEEAFIARLGAMLRRQPESSEFRRLVAAASEIDALRIHRSPPPGAPRYRGLHYEYDPEGPFGAPYHPDDWIWLELTLDASWGARQQPPSAGVIAHLVLLVISSQQTQCLCPSASPLAPDHRMRDTFTRVPADAPARLLQLDSTTGVHTLLAILTRDPFGDAIHSELRQDVCSNAALEQIALTLRERDAARWTCVKRRYYVDAP
jgi:hypothetical protein